MWGAVDEVRPGDQGGGQADHRAIEGGDEDFGMCVEGIRHFEVISHEAGQPVPADVGARRDGTRHFDICTTAETKVSSLCYDGPIATKARREDIHTRKRSAPSPSEP